jgi:hypothetical protein
MAIKRDIADAMFSDAVRMSRGYKCERCGIQGEKGMGFPMLDLAHIYSRRHKSTRWDTLNGLCLCRTCHMEFESGPIDFTRWLEEYVGAGYLEILGEKRNQIFKTTKLTRKEIAAHYRAEIKLMEAGDHDLVSYQ